MPKSPKKGRVAMPMTPLALPAPTAAEPPHAPLVPERSDFLAGGEAPAAAKVEAFLAQAFAASGSESPAQAFVPWICDALLSDHSVKAYGRDLMDFVRHMRAQGVDPLLTIRKVMHAETGVLRHGTGSTRALDPPGPLPTRQSPARRVRGRPSVQSCSTAPISANSTAAQRG